MNFMLMGFEQRGEWEHLSEAERALRVGRHQQALQELIAARDRTPGGSRDGRLLLMSVGLGPAGAATTVRVDGRRPVVTDGPFAETKEVLAGFDIIDFATRTEAVDFCRQRCTHEGHISEIRPARQVRWVYRGAGRGDVTKFVLMITNHEASLLRMPEEERERGAEHHGAAALEYATSRGIVRQESLAFCGVRLEPSATATTLRWSGGKPLVADGPFAETKEVIGGVSLIDCASKQEAIEWAGKIAYPDRDVIEVRPVESAWWIYYG